MQNFVYFFVLTQKSNKKVKKETIYSMFLSYALMKLFYCCNFSKRISISKAYPTLRVAKSIHLLATSISY